MVKSMQEQIDSGPLIGKAKKIIIICSIKIWSSITYLRRIFFPQTDAIQASIH